MKPSSSVVIGQRCGSLDCLKFEKYEGVIATQQRRTIARGNRPNAVVTRICPRDMYSTVYYAKSCLRNVFISGPLSHRAANTLLPRATEREGKKEKRRKKEGKNRVYFNLSRSITTLYHPGIIRRRINQFLARARESLSKLEVSVSPLPAPMRFLIITVI